MTRPPRLELADGLYHVTSRGNERRFIFRIETDRIGFLETLERSVERFHWQCLAYCLMGNHYHSMLKTPIPNLSRGMRHLNGVYAQRFNARHRRVQDLTLEFVRPEFVPSRARASPSEPPQSETTNRPASKPRASDGVQSTAI